MFSGKRYDRCLLTIYPAKLKSRTQRTGVARMQNAVFASEVSLGKRSSFVTRHNIVSSLP